MRKEKLNKQEGRNNIHFLWKWSKYEWSHTIHYPSISVRYNWCCFHNLRIINRLLWSHTTFVHNLQIINRLMWSHTTFVCTKWINRSDCQCNKPKFVSLIGKISVNFNFDTYRFQTKYKNKNKTNISTVKIVLRQDRKSN